MSPLRLRLWNHLQILALDPILRFNKLNVSQNTVYSLPRHSSSSSRWQNRQAKDRYAQGAKVQGLKSRAAFKLLEINEKYKIFRNGQTVVDLGYAPGSWSQVAVDRTAPNGRVVGIDIIPSQPPKGVSTLQGNFLSKAVQDEAKKFLRDSDRGRNKQHLSLASQSRDNPVTPEDLAELSRGYLELEKRANTERGGGKSALMSGSDTLSGRSHVEHRLVDVILSDMSEPWAQIDNFWKRSLNDPYYRMMNTSGNGFRDHTGSMDLCSAAIDFAFETLRTGGHFICKFYQGSEDKTLELRLRTLFMRVYREKPESSRSESKEAYFVALNRKADAKKEKVHF